MNEQMIEMPPVVFPLVTRVISEGTELRERTVWELGASHPEIEGALVRRIFIVGETVEIYSDNMKSSPAKPGFVRDVVPMGRVIRIQETMPIDTYVEEIRAANESIDPDEEPEEEDDEEESGVDPGILQSTAPNGSSS